MKWKLTNPVLSLSHTIEFILFFLLCIFKLQSPFSNQLYKGKMKQVATKKKRRIQAWGNMAPWTGLNKQKVFF
jgi:hypothetical protein